MKRETVESSNIKSMGHDPDTETLEIEFTSGGVYQYAGVPRDVFEAFAIAPSAGHYFATHVRDQFKTTRVETKDPGPQRFVRRGTSTREAQRAPRELRVEIG